jgi:hypothetical protein
MWKASGGTRNQETWRWLELPTTRKFIKALAKKLNLGKSEVLKTIRGRNGGTYVHWQIALAYVKYLSPDFYIWCNEVPVISLPVQICNTRKGHPQFELESV